MSRIRLGTCLLVVALFGVGACGGGDDNPAVDTAGGSSTSTTSAAKSAAASGDKVEIKGFAFNPKDVTVKVGATVTWTHADDASHTVTADDDSFKSETLSRGDTFTHTFDKAGTFAYHCSIHSTMTGSVVVQ